MAHYVALIIYNSILEKSVAKWSYVMFIFLAILGFLHLAMAIIGYATFTENTKRMYLFVDYWLKTTINGVSKGVLSELCPPFQIRLISLSRNTY